MLRRAGPRRSRHGFTLIELVITVALAGLLLTVALPAYQQHLRKLRRADALAALVQIQQAQERRRSQQPAYTATLGSGGLELGSLSSAGHYRLSISTPEGLEATDHTALAEATGAQSADADCRVLALITRGGVLQQRSGPSTALGNDAAADRRCWGR